MFRLVEYIFTHKWTVTGGPVTAYVTSLPSTYITTPHNILDVSFFLHIMSDDWEAKTVIGFRRQTAKVTKKDSDLNGAYSSEARKLFTLLTSFMQP